MKTNVVIFEGYDGAGKGTVINGLVANLPKNAVRVIGRKSEPALKPISRLIEEPVPPLAKSAELLLRISLEIERLKIVEEYRTQCDFVFLDRGFISANAWTDYYNLNPKDYAPFFGMLERQFEGATLIFCECDFPRCWRRMKQKKELSKKELLGKAVNAEWFAKYKARCDAFHNSRFEIARVDTTTTLKSSLKQALAALPK